MVHRVPLGAVALLVQKFGGTSVGDPERIREVADHVGIAAAFAGPSEVVVGADESTPVDYAAIDVIREQSKKRKQMVPATTTYGTGVSNAYPLEVTVGGATIFVQHIERFEKL